MREAMSCACAANGRSSRKRARRRSFIECISGGVAGAKWFVPPESAGCRNISPRCPPAGGEVKPLSKRRYHHASGRRRATQAAAIRTSLPLGDSMHPVIPAAVAAAIGLAQAPANGATLEIHTTVPGGPERLALTGTATLAPGKQPPEGEVSVFVDPTKTYQPFLGIGGAITDASAEVFAKLAPREQEHLLRAYYDPTDGIGYTLARTTIHS